jgi:hypothetical protein
MNLQTCDDETLVSTFYWLLQAMDLEEPYTTIYRSLYKRRNITVYCSTRRVIE